MRYRSHGTASYRSLPTKPKIFANIIRSSELFKTNSIVSSTAISQTPEVDFMFGELSSDANNRLPENLETIKALRLLGTAMANDPSNEESRIPAAYTYFGQFIDHDITKTTFSLSLQPAAGLDPIEVPDLKPLNRSELQANVFNDRSAFFDLDSVYEGDAERTINADDTFQLSILSPTQRENLPAINTADKNHDLKRMEIIQNPITDEQKRDDRRALIGDPRNDENLLVSQLHVAILRSHNALIRRNMDFSAARTAIRRRYQWSVLTDFLPRICSASVINDLLENGPKHWKVNSKSELFMPAEFMGAAFRFGHSMIRASYEHNSTFSTKNGFPALFNFMFTFTALSGDLQPGDGHSAQSATLPDNWPIEWHRFFESNEFANSQNPARRIDTKITPELGKLRNFQGMPFPSIMASLAARNLLRGYLLGLPTGQAVARRLGVPLLHEDVLRQAIPAEHLATIEEAGLIHRTPLWFYILAESGDPAGSDGQKLGVVGSTIVAETIWNCIRWSEDSVLVSRPSEEELATGEYTLRGLIKIGQDSNMPPL